MIEEYEKRKRNQIASMKSILDYGMGVLILLLGVFFLFRSLFGKIPLNVKFPPDNIDKIAGVFFIVYGAWRIYRGYQKRYFK